MDWDVWPFVVVNKAKLLISHERVSMGLHGIMEYKLQGHVTPETFPEP